MNAGIIWLFPDPSTSSQYDMRDSNGHPWQYYGKHSVDEEAPDAMRCDACGRWTRSGWLKLWPRWSAWHFACNRCVHVAN